MGKCDLTEDMVFGNGSKTVLVEVKAEDSSVTLVDGAEISDGEHYELVYTK